MTRRDCASSTGVTKRPPPVGEALENGALQHRDVFLLFKWRAMFPGVQKNGHVFPRTSEHHLRSSFPLELFLDRLGGLIPNDPSHWVPGHVINRQKKLPRVSPVESLGDAEVLRRGCSPVIYPLVNKHSCGKWMNMAIYRGFSHRKW